MMQIQRLSFCKENFCVGYALGVLFFIAPQWQKDPLLKE